MRRNRLLFLVGIVIAVFVIAAVACDDDDDDMDQLPPMKFLRIAAPAVAALRSIRS